MTSLTKVRIPHVLKWVSSVICENASGSSKSNLCVNGSYPVIRFYSRLTQFDGIKYKNVAQLAKRSPLVRKEAQAALSDYLHTTGTMEMMDAEYVSKNCPKFFYRLFKKLEIGDNGDIGNAVRRFLRYNPINEYEPFFESIGLNQSEYTPLVPRDSVFLHDDKLLLVNYNALFGYGIPRNRIGKFFKEAREIFRYDYGVLSKKLNSFQEQGLRQSFVIKIVASSPCLLVQDSSVEFVEGLRELGKAGVRIDWLEHHISEEESYNWKVILELVHLLRKTGFSDEQLEEVIREHCDLLLEQPGQAVIRLFGFLFKIGFTPGDIKTMFTQLPDISVAKFTSNLCQCYEFLVKINMKCGDIGKIVRVYPIFLGSCELKKVKQLLFALNCETKHLCQMILDDPNVLKDWVKHPLPRSGLEDVRTLKTKFLLNLGYKEDSEEMKRAMKLIKGRALELQERFDCLVDLGLSREEVTRMVKVSPKILSSSKNLTLKKINSFLDLGYSVSDLTSHPNILCFAVERVKLRLLVHQWLRDQGVVPQRSKQLALGTLLSLPDEEFKKMYVQVHPKGLEYWEKLKKKLDSET